MTSRIYAVVATATLLISDLTWVEQTSAQSVVPARAPGYEAGAPTTDVRARRHYNRVHYSYYRPTVPYDGYPPYALPIYHCPYFAPNPFYPYCRAW
jgi:hypothetical protein